MTCKLFRYTWTILLTLMVSGTLTCCFDYDGPVVNGEDDSSEDFGIAFDIALNTIPGGATRAEDYGDDIDNEVDVEGTNHDFRILLFDQNDNFLFEPLRVYYQYELEDLGKSDYESTGVQTKHWRVVIPSSALKRQIDDNTTILDKIKKESFKIAVLANWPRQSNSPLEFKQGDKLYKLSHYWTDNVYTSNSNAFGFLSDEGKMGACTEWVKSTYNNQEAARNAICNEEREDPHTIMRKIPTVRKEGTYPHTYKHIWRVWHFGDIYKQDNSICEEIKDLSTNEKILNAWIRQFQEDQKYFEDQTAQTITDFTNYGNIYEGEDDGLTLGDINDEDQSKSKLATGSYSPEGLTVAMGLTTNENNLKNSTYIEGNRLKFNAFAAGTIRVWAKKASELEKCSLYVQVKDNNSSNNFTNRKFLGELTNEFKAYTIMEDGKISNIGVTGAGSEKDDAPLTIPEVVSIYAVDGSMTIKQIEFIEDKHLSDTDREGFLPGENKGQLIPMYGIQEFGAIGDRMVPGEIFNLSEQKDNYQYGKVHLLRSLAKVELLIPTGFLQLTHAYLRCVNRSSRCEPVNVSTSTYELWNKVDTEISNIRSYGPFYDPTTSDYKTYRNKLSWFYLTWSSDWTDNKWTWNGYDLSEADYPKNLVSQYPRIFNPRIDRSDYVHFIYKGKKDGYDYYVLYVPEKNIDDPSTHGSLKSTPKVPHIELRFKDVNNEENLDDNDCYRIYFTDQNNTDKLPSISNKYDGAEQTVLENYGTSGYPELYPIVRNHIYRFTLSGSGQVVSCTVSAWDKLETVIKFK